MQSKLLKPLLEKIVEKHTIDKLDNKHYNYLRTQLNIGNFFIIKHEILPEYYVYSNKLNIKLPKEIFSKNVDEKILKIIRYLIKRAKNAYFNYLLNGDITEVDILFGKNNTIVLAYKGNIIEIEKYYPAYIDYKLNELLNITNFIKHKKVRKIQYDYYKQSYIVLECDNCDYAEFLYQLIYDNIYEPVYVALYDWRGCIHTGKCKINFDYDNKDDLIFLINVLRSYYISGLHNKMLNTYYNNFAIRRNYIELYSMFGAIGITNYDKYFSTLYYVMKTVDKLLYGKIINEQFLSEFYNTIYAAICKSLKENIPLDTILSECIVNLLFF